MSNSAEIVIEHVFIGRLPQGILQLAKCPDVGWKIPNASSDVLWHPQDSDEEQRETDEPVPRAGETRQPAGGGYGICMSSGIATPSGPQPVRR